MSSSPARAALVTGASTGLGLAIAAELAGSGHAVTMASRRADRLEAAAAPLLAAGHTVRTHALDVRDADALAALVAAHARAYGRLDVLANSAGLGVNSAVADTSDKHIDLQLGVNIRAIVVLYRQALPLLLEAAGEHRNALVLNVASITARRPEPNQAVYAATKAAIIAFTQAMNEEVGGRGIKSTALCPGYVDTEMTEFLRDRVPREEMIPLADIAASVRWLLTLSPQTVVPELPLMRAGGIV
jgi:3-oxoacyl-[acyl-carrier protein] reductase